MNTILTESQASSASAAAPRLAPESPPPPSRKGVITAMAVVVLVGAGLWVVSKTRASAAPTVSGNITAKVVRGDFIRRVRVQGTVAAVSFYPIAAPRLSGPGMGTLRVTKLSLPGQTVKKGDLLVEFDQQAQIKNALDRQAEYVDFVQQIRKKQADQAALRAADETALKQAENAMKAASLELKRNEILSKIDAEKNQESYEEAKSTFEQLKATFDLKRKAAVAEVRSLEIQRDRAQQAMDYAQKNTERLSIHSPIDGIVVLNTIWKGSQMGEVQEGDEVRPGVPFLQVVNAGTMEVRARVNQADVNNLNAGAPVNIGLDAYPELAFKGKVERVAAIGVTSGLNRKVRSFQAIFSLEGTSPQLMPDLSASVDVEVERKPSVLLAPRDSVVHEGEDDFVYVSSGAGYEKRKVQLAGVSDLQVAISSGVDEGAQVLRNARPQ